jgi:signal transduction histidine kinase
MVTGSGLASQQSVTRRLTRRYILALSTIALLSVLGQIAAQITLNQSAHDASVINIAALQRTLSEQLSKDALAILANADTPEQNVYTNDMLAVVAQWQHTQLALQHGDLALGLQGHNSPAVTRLYARIAPSFNTMLDAATALLAIINSQPPVRLPTTPPLQPQIAPYVQQILAAEPGFIGGMGDIIAEYQHEAEGRVTQLQVIERTLLAIVLLDIVLLVVVVFRPATRYVGQSIADLVRAQERERELAALKDQFIIDANHELRTPIMSLYNNLEVLAALGERGTPEQRARILQRALSSGDAVIRLLTSVLDTGALEGKAPQLSLKAVALAPLVRGVLETFDPREIGEPGLQTGEHQPRPVSVQIPPDLAVWADEDRLRQVLINLLGNALKYSGPGSPINVWALARATPRADHIRQRDLRSGEATAREQIQISVQDRGNGVPPRDIPKLFNRFVRLERDIAGPVRGTGVGLYMCRVLVEAMGGRIWVDSSGVPGEGSTFSFVLPAAPREPAFGAFGPLETAQVTARLSSNVRPLTPRQ